MQRRESLIHSLIFFGSRGQQALENPRGVGGMVIPEALYLPMENLQFFKWWEMTYDKMSYNQWAMYMYTYFGIDSNHI